MLFVSDESVDGAISTKLRSDGHEVWSVAEEAPSITDEEVLELARERGAVLITEDKDFGELVFRAKMPHVGVVLVRLPDQFGAEKAETVSHAIREHLHQLPDAFTVIAHGSVRSRSTR